MNRKKAYKNMALLKGKNKNILENKIKSKV